MAMTPVSGHGAAIIVDPSGAATQFEDTDWTINKTGVHADITDSSTAGYQKFKGIVKGGTFTINGVWDDTTIPDTDVALDMNDETTIKFEVGSGSKFYQFAAIIETLTVTNDNRADVVRYSISGKINGSITDPVT